MTLLPPRTRVAEAALPDGTPFPDGDAAREWAERELADPRYARAEPTPFDRAAQAVAHWFTGLFEGDLTGGWGAALAVVIALVVVAVIALAFLVWGRPRLRATSRPAHALFDGDAARSAAALRGDAARAVAEARWDDAVVLRFRAAARGLAERDIVDAPPGMTVHAFAQAATRAFPALSGRLQAAASAFDDVRYLRRPGTQALYETVAATDDALAGARPVVREAVVTT